MIEDKVEMGKIIFRVLLQCKAKGLLDGENMVKEGFSLWTREITTCLYINKQ